MPGNADLSRVPVESGPAVATPLPAAGLERGPVVRVRIAALRESYSPRAGGASAAHVRALAEVLGELPPIVVHRATMRVIDGTHRMRAAVLRGRTEIDAVFVEGSEADAFVLAVAANVTHGLPLSLPERVAAAERIVRTHPQWSDRSIAAATGLSSKTVAARRRAAGENPQPNIRIGRDGRAHPLDNTEGRRLAGEMIARDPGLSLREVATAAGISPGTVRSVRERVRRGEDPVLPRQRDRCRREVDPAPPFGLASAASTVDSLRRDPWLRFTEPGRMLLRLLNVHSAGEGRWNQLVDTIPEHCLGLVADAARRYASTWEEFAERLDQRTVRTRG